MAVTAKVFLPALTSLLNKEIDWGTDTVKVMLCDSTFVPNQATMQYKSSITGEVSGPGYTAGGQALSGKTETFSGNIKILGASPSTWPSSSITGAHFAVVYVDTGTDATSPLLSYADFGGDLSSSNGEIDVTWDAAGVVSFTVA